MKDALIVSALSLLPRRTGARGMGWFARTGASRALTGAFVRAYGVDLDEAEHALTAYPTLEALFTRRLKEGARPVDATRGVMVSPVDGRCAAVGRTTNGAIDVAPGRPLDVHALVGDGGEGERDVAVLYLSPRDYHRVHAPYEGRITRWRYVPGTLWPVFPAAVRRVRGLFARNERAVVHLATDRGPLDVVLVGAFGVGRITLSCCDLVTNQHARPTAASSALSPEPALERADELGVFHLGSTVVIVAPPGRWRFDVAPGETVRLGRAIASALPEAGA